MVPTDRRDIHRAVRTLIQDSSEAELREALAGSSETFEDLAAGGRAIVARALAGSATPTDAADVHGGLGALVRLLRRRDGLSEAELASRAAIDIAELRALESDPRCEPNPRTIFQLEHYFKLRPRTLVLLSGAVRLDSTVREEVLRFAASSRGMAKLSRHEVKLLNRFVKFLGDHTDG